MKRILLVLITLLFSLSGVNAQNFQDPTTDSLCPKEVDTVKLGPAEKQ